MSARSIHLRLPPSSASPLPGLRPLDFLFGSPLFWPHNRGLCAFTFLYAELVNSPCLCTLGCPTGSVTNESLSRATPGPLFSWSPLAGTVEHEPRGWVFAFQTWTAAPGQMTLHLLPCPPFSDSTPSLPFLWKAVFIFIFVVGVYPVPLPQRVPSAVWIPGKSSAPLWDTAAFTVSTTRSACPE